MTLYPVRDGAGDGTDVVRPIRGGRLILDLGDGHRAGGVSRREPRMAFKVQVGPAQITIHQGQTVLVTAPDGQVSSPGVRGLYFRDTRVINAWSIYANGEPWDLLNGGAVAHHAARIFLTNRAIASVDGPIAARTVGLVSAPYRWRHARRD